MTGFADSQGAQFLGERPNGGRAGSARESHPSVPISDTSSRSRDRVLFCLIPYGAGYVAGWQPASFGVRLARWLLDVE
jgi:hypothetical protein